jgi:predicted flap endonuclease-1-like 5' DNA nuclease
VTSDDFTRIRGIDKELQAGLVKLGVHRFAEIAAWRKPDIRRISEALGLRRSRIAQENWIEQAQILMGGKETAFSRRNHGAPPLAKPSADQGEQRANTDKQRLGAAASGMAAAVAASVAAAPRRPVLALGRDNLQRISRISEDVERLLNVQGVSRYHQIANWTSADVTRFDRLLGGERRISRENWIEQAQILAPGGETAYAREFDKLHAAAAPAGPRPTQLAEAIRTASQGTARKVDLSKLRSVRSEAFHSGDGGQAAAGAAAPAADDLKRIRGVGVLIEKRLNNMGYRTYAQVANWTAADVDRVSKTLDFGGRIERENWVEQARILASGGQTEFARRVDRGEVETSRSRP